MENMSKFDKDGDGKLTDNEFTLYKENEKLQAELDKQDNQANMAWTAMISMIVFTVIMFTPWVPESRLETIASASDLFYIAQAGIVGAFMGATALMKRK